MHSWHRTGPSVHSLHSGSLSINRWINTLDYLGSCLGPICSPFQIAFHHPGQGLREGSLLVPPPLTRRGSPAARNTVSNHPSLLSLLCQALPAPPQVRVLSGFHTRRRNSPLRSHLLWLWATVTWLLSGTSWVDLALFAGWVGIQHLSQAWFQAHVLGLTLRTTPAGVATAGAGWERGELYNRGPAGATRGSGSHLVLQRARPHQPACTCTLRRWRGCERKPICKTRAILGKRLSREPSAANIWCFRPEGVSDSSHCISMPAKVHLNIQECSVFIFKMTHCNK